MATPPTGPKANDVVIGSATGSAIGSAIGAANAARAANAPFRLPPPLFDARCKACWFSAALLLLVVASFASLNLQWGQFLSLEAMRSMGRFLAEFFPPDTSPEFLRRVALGTWETLAMSALGTVLAAAAGLALALPASRLHAEDPARARAPTRLLLNALRSIPELVWAGLLLIAAGLGQLMDGSMKMFNGGEVATMLLVFMALVALADRVSAGLRKSLG